MKTPKLKSWLGIAHRVGSVLCYFIMKSNCQVITRTTFQPISQLDKDKGEIISEENPNINDNGPVINQHAKFYLQDEEWYYEESFGFKEAIVDDVDNHEDDIHDEFVGAKVILPNVVCIESEKVVRRKRDNEGNIIGERSNNLLRDTSTYEVKFSSGKIQEVMSNKLSKCMMDQCDMEGHKYLILHSILNHRK